MKPNLFGSDFDDCFDDDYDPEPAKEPETTIKISEIQKITVNENEKLVVKIPDDASEEDVRSLIRNLQAVFPDAASRVIIVRKGVDFEAVEIRSNKDHPLYE